MSLFLDKDSLRHTLIQSFLIKALIVLLKQSLGDKGYQAFFREWVEEQESIMIEEVESISAIMEEAESPMTVTERDNLETNMYLVMDEIEGWLRTSHLEDD